MKYSNVTFLFAIVASLACLQAAFATPLASPDANPLAESSPHALAEPSADAAALADSLAEPLLRILTSLLGKK